VSRVAVVTGAAGGIGAATCDLLEERGWRVVAVDRVPPERDGAIQLDLADPDAVMASLSALPEVHGLVNNAAIQLFQTIAETTVAEWDAVMATNLRAPFLCLKALREQLVASRGSVVNVASVHARATSQSIAAYAASKGGLVAFTRAAALELAPHGVRVNAVLPGAVDTPALEAGLGRAPDAEERLLERTPLGRVAAPAEIAESVAFLLDTERSGFVSGQELVIDGGALARLGTE
jgi:NAD(P)-dependent dehydrogenase (short-subunit alcohol dehydrogenase family)